MERIVSEITSAASRYVADQNLKGSYASAGATRYAADQHRAASEYSADAAKAASIFGALQASSASRYSADQHRAASQYSSDRSYQANKDKLNQDWSQNQQYGHSDLTWVLGHLFENGLNLFGYSGKDRYSGK